MLIVMMSSFAGCLDSFTSDDSDGSGFYPDLKQRHQLDWNMTNTHSRVLEDGPHYALDVQEVFIEVDTSEVWETGPSESEIHLSYWLPSNTLDGDQVPVIVIVSPDASPKVVLPLTVKSCTSDIVTFLLPITT